MGMVSQVKSRPYVHGSDFEKMMNFLRRTYSETGSLDNWLPPRFENSAKENESDTYLWETPDGEVVAAATPEEKLRYFVQLNPSYTYLVSNVVDWVIDHCGEESPRFVLLESNKILGDELHLRGFERNGVYGILRLRDVGSPIPDCPLPKGFSVRHVEQGDYEELASAIRTVFGHGEWFNEEILRELSKTSFYHIDLDLIALDNAGAIASFCSFRLDEPSGITELEPVGTLAKYRGLGLAKALLCEGFRRLRTYKPTLLYIGGAADTPAANRLYEETGFTAKRTYYTWMRPATPRLLKNWSDVVK